LNDIIGEWHATIGKAILENWDFSEAMAQAVGDQADFSRADDGPPDLSDVIAVAILMAAHGEDAPGLEAALKGLGAAKRLRLDEEKNSGGDSRVHRRSHGAQSGSRKLGA